MKGYPDPVDVTGVFTRPNPVPLDCVEEPFPPLDRATLSATSLLITNRECDAHDRANQKNDEIGTDSYPH